LRIPPWEIEVQKIGITGIPYPPNDLTLLGAYSYGKRTSTHVRLEAKMPFLRFVLDFYNSKSGAVAVWV